MLRRLATRDPVEIQANNLWATAQPDVKLTITIPDGAAFKFTSGNLASDFTWQPKMSATPSTRTAQSSSLYQVGQQRSGRNCRFRENNREYDSTVIFAKK